MEVLGHDRSAESLTEPKQRGRPVMYTKEELLERRRIRDRARYQWNKINNPEFIKQYYEKSRERVIRHRLKKKQPH